MPFNLGLFHKREAEPAQWAVFDSVDKDEDDLIDDLDALAGLEAVGAAEPVKRSMASTYRFPQQETKLRGGQHESLTVCRMLTAVGVQERNGADVPRTCTSRTAPKAFASPRPERWNPVPFPPPF